VKLVTWPADGTTLAQRDADHAAAHNAPRPPVSVGDAINYEQQRLIVTRVYWCPTRYTVKPGHWRIAARDPEPASFYYVEGAAHCFTITARG